MNIRIDKKTEKIPSVFDDFFKPWNEWFDNDGSLTFSINVPTVNITEKKDEYQVLLAAPGLKKDDFKIAADGNMLTISSQKEETKEKEKRLPVKEYNFSSFSKCFTLPEEISKKIEATYEDGSLKIALPCKKEANELAAKETNVK